MDSIENFYLGENYGDEVAHWLKIDPVETRGVLILPLRGHTGAVFGMICLCDADEKKFTQGTSPKFLKMAAKVAETALTPLSIEYFHDRIKFLRSSLNPARNVRSFAVIPGFSNPGFPKYWENRRAVRRSGFKTVKENS